MRQQEEEWDRGFASLSRDHVCDECVDDETLASLIRSNAVADTCDYCGRSSAGPIAAATDLVIEAIYAGINAEYERALDILPWDGAEGGWQGARTWNSNDLLWEVGWPFVNEDFADDVADALGEEEWCQRVFTGVGAEDLELNWHGFVETVTRRRRFLFGGVDSLAAVGELFSKYELLADLSSDQILSRVRVHDGRDQIRCAADLGTTPIRSARANRISAAGIPLFYGALDDETAIAETVDPVDAAESKVALGHFQPIVPLRVLDLTRLPAPPSLFDVERREQRGDLLFLNSFVREVSKPVRRDGTEHIDYVPTQILCEYIRHGFADGEVAGILFRSTMSPEGTVAALFVDREDCLEPNADADLDRRQLRLVNAEEVDVEVSVGSSGTRPIEFAAPRPANDPSS
jgi:hypothetical protein